MKASAIIRKQTKRGYPLHHTIILDSYNSFYWSWVNFSATFDEWQKAAALSERYRSFVHYCREIAPQWQTVDVIYYADNSTSAVQTDKQGNRREVMVTAPSGDVS